MDFFSPMNIAFLVFICDQASKIIVVTHIKRSIVVIPAFFNLVLLRNKGAAWGKFSEYPLLLTILAASALTLLIIFFKKLSEGKRMNEIALSLLAGGIAGNLFDRLARGSVLDFLDFHIKNYSWPAFNIADSAITVSIILLIFLSFAKDEKKTDIS